MTLLLRLRAVNMLLCQLSTQRYDLVLQSRDFFVVFLLHPGHASFYLANILPYVNLVTHDLTHAATTATMTRHASGLRAASRGRHGLVLEHAWSIAFTALRALLRGHGTKSWQRWQVRPTACGRRSQADGRRSPTTSIILLMDVMRQARRA